MQNLIVNTVMLHLRSRSVALLKNHFTTSQALLGRCCGPAKGEDKKKDPKKCMPPTPPPPPKSEKQVTKAAVVLSGCGHLDGTCIYEAVCVAISLYRNGVTPAFFAPKGPQADVINHQTSCPSNEERCAIREGARLARGKIQNLTELRYCDVSSVIFPGGLGITKTFTTFEADKANCCVDVEVMRVLQEFHDARKPMAFTGLAAILAARLFPCVKITLGMKGKLELWPCQHLIEIACQMGADIETREVDGFSFDKQHMVFSTPAFLYNGNCAQVLDGISIMTQNMVKYFE